MDGLPEELLSLELPCLPTSLVLGELWTDRADSFVGDAKSRYGLGLEAQAKPEQQILLYLAEPAIAFSTGGDLPFGNVVWGRAGVPRERKNMVPSELVEVTETVCTLTWRWSSRHSCPLFVQRDAPPNGLELSCPAARATAHPFSRILAGEARSNFPSASRVSCSEVLGGGQFSQQEEGQRNAQAERRFGRRGSEAGRRADLRSALATPSPA